MATVRGGAGVIAAIIPAAKRTLVNRPQREAMSLQGATSPLVAPQLRAEAWAFLAMPACPRRITPMAD